MKPLRPGKKGLNFSTHYEMVLRCRVATKLDFPFSFSLIVSQHGSVGRNPGAVVLYQGNLTYSFWFSIITLIKLMNY